MNAREAAAKTVIEIIDKKVPSHVAITAMLRKNETWNAQERGFAKRLADGTVRYLIPIDYLLDAFSKTPVKKIKPWLRAVLRTAVYQLIFCNDIPASATCNEAVKLAKKYGFANLGGFVNGVLRSIDREGVAKLQTGTAVSYTERLRLTYSVPSWLIQQWVRDYGEETAEKIAAAAQEDSRLTVRCNISRTSPEELLASLEKDGVTAEPATYAEHAYYLYGCDGIEKLEAFRKGWFQIQDESSILVGQIAGIRGGEHVLDLCAAPGGKSLHIADLLAYYAGSDRVVGGCKGQLEARDVSEQKLHLIRENLERNALGNVTLVCADATVFDPEKENRADLVIADVPCSGTGVTARKPDIKYNMNEESQADLIELQHRILKLAVRYVKPGGTLIFSTCTLNKDENDSGRKLLSELGMKPESLIPYLPACLQSEDAENGFLRLIPGVHGTDGFYISRFIK